MSSFDHVAGPACDSFEKELQDIEQKQSEAVDLEEKERELQKLHKRLRELANEVESARADHRRHSAEAALPVIQPREPCSAAWDQMTGSERVRSCDRCKQRVYDLSSLPADEARRLIQQHEGKLPTHLYSRVDGTVTAGLCEQPKRRKWTPLAVGLAALAAVALLGASGLIGYHLNDAEPPPVLELQVPNLSMALPPPPPAAPTATQPPQAQQPPQPPPAQRRSRCRGHWFGSDGLGMFFYFGDGDPHSSCPEPFNDDEPSY